MKRPSIRFKHSFLYAALVAGLMGAWSSSVAGEGILLADNEAGEEEVYLGGKTPTKEEWLKMLKVPDSDTKSMTRGFSNDDDTRGIHTKFSLDIPFDKASASLSEHSKQQLEPLGEAMETLKNQTLIIEGHTDSKGKVVSNQRLSERRANSVKTYLTENFDVSDKQVRALGLGEKQPLPGHGAADPINRRVAIRTR